MKKLLFLAASFITALSFFSVSLVPVALAETSLSVKDNGSESENEISLDLEKSLDITQSNEADITNDVTVVANTGGNVVSGTSGGDVDIKTGDVDTDVDIKNAVNANISIVEGFFHDNDLRLSVEDNNKDSSNKVDVDKKVELSVEQDNDADIDNKVTVVANTGLNFVLSDDDVKRDFLKDRSDKDKDKDKDDNKDSDGGDVQVETGDVKTNVDILNLANLNYLKI